MTDVARLRHLTVTAFVSQDGQTLLHFHALNQLWLPAGGHLEPNEDPVQAATREAKEETGLDVEILPTHERLPYATPPQLVAPVTIMVEDIPNHPRDGPHQHIDLIYFSRPAARAASPPPAPAGWRWVSAETLRNDTPISPLPDAAPVPIPEDVRVLGLAAIARADQP